MTEESGTKKKSWWGLGAKRARQEELEQSILEQSKEIEQLKEQLQEQHQAHASIKAENQQKEQELEELRSSEQRLNEGYQKMHQELARIEREYEGAKKQVLKEQKSHQQTQQQLATSTTQLDQAHERQKQELQRYTTLEQAYQASQEHILALQEKQATLEQALKQQATEPTTPQGPTQEQGHTSQTSQWGWWLASHALFRTCGRSTTLALQDAWEYLWSDWMGKTGEGQTLSESLEQLKEQLERERYCRSIQWNEENGAYTFLVQHHNSVPDILQQENVSHHSLVGNLFCFLLGKTTGTTFKIHTFSRTENGLSEEFTLQPQASALTS